MKKILSIVMVLMLLLAIAVPASGMSIAVPTCYDLEKYDAFINEIKMRNPDSFPKNFVYWTEISALGRFDSYSHGSINGTHYFISDKYKQFILYVDYAIEIDPHHYDIEKYPRISISDDMTSMRFVPTTERCYINRNNILYYYIDGKLFSIHWYKEGAYITLYDTPLYDYPEQAEGTAFSKLLSLDDKEFSSVVAQLQPDSVTQWQTTKTVFLWVSMAAVVALIVVALVGVLKRKQEEITETDE